MCVCVCNDEQVRITGTTVEWDEMRFDVRLLQRVPVSSPFIPTSHARA